VRELNDEKIDVIEYDTDPAAYIAKALSPARVTGVYLNEQSKGTKTATVVVMEDHLSLAIGRDGQNARLAAKLTSWRIDIKSLLEATTDAMAQLQNDPDYAFLREGETETVPRVEAVLAKKAEGRPIQPEEYHLLSQFVDRVERGLINRRSAEKRAEDDRRKDARLTIPAEAFEMPLASLGLSERVYGLLNDTAGYPTVGDLMLQLAMDSDSILAISGVGPKAMEDIQKQLAAIAWTKAVEEVVEVEPEAEAPAEALPVTEPAAEEEAPIAVEIPAVVPQAAEAVLQMEPPQTGVEQPAAAEEGAVVPPAAEESFGDLFTLKPGDLVTVESDEEEEDGDSADKKGKKKGKKKRFVEVEYDPDRDITLVKHKSKRGEDWSEDLDF
jgi:N utilization substance protein A